MSEEPEERLCEECDEPISSRRLKALPGVRLCIECAEELETRNRGHASHRGRRVRYDEQQRASVVQALRDLTES